VNGTRTVDQEILAGNITFSPKIGSFVQQTIKAAGTKIIGEFIMKSLTIWASSQENGEGEGEGEDTAADSLRDSLEKEGADDKISSKNSYVILLMANGLFYDLIATLTPLGRESASVKDTKEGYIKQLLEFSLARISSSDIVLKRWTGIPIISSLFLHVRDAIPNMSMHGIADIMRPMRASVEQSVPHPSVLGIFPSTMNAEMFDVIMSNKSRHDLLVNWKDYAICLYEQVGKAITKTLACVDKGLSAARGSKSVEESKSRQASITAKVCNNTLSPFFQLLFFFQCKS
tara:strand:- start:1798 stop:2661 length:864 start_codon:yes stop_codon:yes gene_type:complete